MSPDLDGAEAPRHRAVPAPGRQTPALDDTVREWAAAEAGYRSASWAGKPAVIIGRRHGARPVLLTAPHAGHQLRNQWAKPADGGTGGLAETLARLCGCAAVTVRGAQRDDPNWDVEAGPFKREALQRLPRHPFALDLHAMDVQRHVDICIGIGAAPDAATLAFAQQMAALARRHGFLTAVNHPFGAAGPGTMTTFVQNSGYRGMQIEINWRFLDPDGDPRAAARLLTFLREVILAVPPPRP